MTMPRAEIRIEGDEAAILRRALAPEAGREIPKTRVRATGRGKSVTLTIRVKAIQKHEKALGERYEDLGRKIQAALRGEPQAG